MEKLFDAISVIAEKTIPFHMPGHKRNTKLFDGEEGRFLQSLFRYDLTEIEGTDDLHHAEGIILEAQKRAAKMYGAKETFFLVGGSTLGVLAGISAMVPFGGTLLMPRCSHKSVYHACGLRHITPVYMEGKKHPLLGFDEGITPEEVEEYLSKNERTDAVCITSPTYEGKVLDVAGIAKVVHRYKLPLFVDSAHGAHLGIFGDILYTNACENGADVVVHSLHKTLPAPTQTGLLHICSDRVDKEKISYFLGVYETSSPSYPLMIGMDSCLSWVRKYGKNAWESFAERRRAFAGRMKMLQKISLLDYFAGDDLDPCKMVVYDATKSHGTKIAEALRKAGMEPELTAPGYVLLILTPCDEEEGLQKLARVLLAMDDNSWEPGKAETVSCRLPEVRIPFYEGTEAEKEWIPLLSAEGRTSGAMVMLYPPGQPMIVPGEVFTRGLLQQMEALQEAGLHINGLQNGFVQVIKE